MDISDPKFNPSEEYSKFKQWFVDYNIKQNAGIHDTEFEVGGQKIQFRFEYKIDPCSALSIYLEEIHKIDFKDSFKKAKDILKLWEIGGIIPPISVV